MGALAETSKNPYRLTVSHAKGSWIFDDSDKKYLDFISGIGVSALGHAHPHIQKAILRQTELSLHTMVYGEFSQPVVTRFAEKLLSYLPTKLDCLYPVNSGTEAIEAALKLAKRATGRYKICAFKGAYHGNTQGSLSVSWNTSKRQPFMPLLPGITFLEWNDIAALPAITRETAAVIIETIQGDAGVRIPSAEFIQALRKRCDATGTLLILDEIQCGYGRTGTFSAFTPYGITPDILVMGKAIGGGLPMGVLIAPQSLLDVFTYTPSLGHITTFGGHPLPAAAGLAALEVLESEHVMDGIEQRSRFLLDRLQNLPAIAAIRCKGLMFGIELKDEASVNQIIDRCKSRGLLLYWFLSVRNAFRISPPLNISMEDLKWGFEILEEELGNLHQLE
jgi:acetylornithine/succinyldiaminopimelate/putrescine aminotransferase